MIEVTAEQAEANRAKHMNVAGERGAWNWPARLIHIKRNVASTQAYGAWLCLHIGTVAIFLGSRNGHALRIELFTPFHRFRMA